MEQSHGKSLCLSAVFYWPLLASVSVFGNTLKARLSAQRQTPPLATETVKLKTDIIQRELSEHKVHSAETFATKSGLAESLTRVHDALDRLSDRIDTLIQQGQ